MGHLTSQPDHDRSGAQATSPNAGFVISERFQENRINAVHLLKSELVGKQFAVLPPPSIIENRILQFGGVVIRISHTGR